MFHEYLNVRSTDLDLNCVDTQPGSAMYYLYELRRVSQTLHASVLASVKWEHNCTCLRRIKQTETFRRVSGTLKELKNDLLSLALFTV